MIKIFFSLKFYTGLIEVSFHYKWDGIKGMRSVGSFDNGVIRRDFEIASERSLILVPHSQLTNSKISSLRFRRIALNLCWRNTFGKDFVTNMLTTTYFNWNPDVFSQKLYWRSLFTHTLLIVIGDKNNPLMWLLGESST